MLAGFGTANRPFLEVPDVGLSSPGMRLLPYEFGSCSSLNIRFIFHYASHFQPQGTLFLTIFTFSKMDMGMLTLISMPDADRLNH